VNLFYESSTRTSSSFELAAKRLSADVVSIRSQGSAVDKGESLKDTVQTLSAYDPAAIVIRSPHAGAAGLVAGWTPAAARAARPAELDAATIAELTSRERLLQFLATQSNDLESAAIALAPAVAEVLAALRALAGCRLARMSGSGATCFALFSSTAATQKAAKALRSKYPRWWVRACVLGRAPRSAGTKRGGRKP